MLISIIIPIYNVESYLRECIDSVLSQSYRDIEVILVNDGSVDKCGDICKCYAAADERIRVINKANGGLSDARNVGMVASQGTYILFLDGDDYWGKDFLHKIHQLIEDNNHPDMVFVDSIYNVFPRGKTIEVKCGFDPLEFDTLKTEAALEYIFTKTKLNAWSAWRNVYKADFIKSNNLFFKVSILCEDAEWTPRVILSAETMALYEEPFYVYRVARPHSIMSTCSQKKMSDYMKVVSDWIDYSNRLENKELSSIIKSKFSNDFVSYFCYIYFFGLEFRVKLISDIQRINILNYVDSEYALELKRQIDQRGYEAVLRTLNQRYRARESIKYVAVKLRLIDR